MSNNISEIRGRIVRLLLLLAWMGVIFAFSSQNGEESTQLSSGFADLAAKMFAPDYASMTVLQKESTRNTFSFLIRKSAHFAEYAVLGALTYNFIRYEKIGKWLGRAISWIICIIYAVSDEYHQSFSDGRAPRILDVCIDSMGALFGIIMVILVVNYVYLYRKKKKSR